MERVLCVFWSLLLLVVVAVVGEGEKMAWRRRKERFLGEDATS